VAGWALMTGHGWNTNVWANGHTPSEFRSPWFLAVSPRWLEAMHIPLLEGRDFRIDDSFPRVAAVNQAFARRYFDGRSPVGQFFETVYRGNQRVRVQIIALVGDARYTGMRGPIPATAYVPFQTLNENGMPKAEAWGTFIIRTRADNPLALASTLRQEARGVHSAFRLANVRTQDELVKMHTIRERLLATLSLFFAAVALVLAGVGLYGVLDYAVLERRRELGIRIALGAGRANIARKVTIEVFLMLMLGGVAGLALGLGSERFIRTLLYQVKATDSTILITPALTILIAAICAALPPVLRAMRVDPAALLKAD